MEDKLFHIISQFALTPNFKFPADHPVFNIENDGLTVRCPDSRITNKYEKGTILVCLFFPILSCSGQNTGSYLTVSTLNILGVPT